MYSIIFLAPLIPLAYAFRRSPGWLFVCIYLPALLLVPDTFHTVTLGIPKMSVNQAVIMAILPFALFRYARQWRPSMTDAMVFALVALMALSEYLAAGYKEAQNLAFAMTASAVAPYLVARLVIAAEGLHVDVARRFVLLLFAVVLLSTYEFKFGWNPFLVLPQALFPGQGTGWVTTFRYGFARVAGPYAHAILAGIMILIAYRLQRWLQRGGHWEPHFSALPGLPWSKASIITAALLLGAVMTIARGPWIGAALGAVLVAIGRSREPKRALVAIGIALLLLLPVAYVGIDAYLDVQPGMQISTSQQTALYRKELVEKYVNIAIDHAWLGWGRNTWPRVPGMPSIDNYYLLLSLMHGLLATLVLTTLFFWQSARLVRYGMREGPQANSLAFTFAGILIGIFVSLGTVYLGEQVIPALFLILGWSESLLAKPAAVAVTADAAQPRAARHSFRVLQ